MGVRYLALPRRNGPGGRLGHPLPAVDAAVRNQLDLARLSSDPGLELYVNQAWFPGRTVLRGRRASVPARPLDPARAATATDLTGSPPLGNGPAGPGTALWFEAYDAGWHAHQGGAALAHRPAFGTTNQFRLPSHAPVTISHTGQTRAYALVAAEVVLWLLALVWWSRGRARAPVAERAAARAAARAAREERRRGRGDDELASDVEFWEQG
jgi:hypothetical protein